MCMFVCWYRVLKKLKAKDDKQIELERREQGFSLYMNGANVGRGFGEAPKFSPRKPTKPKTAGGNESDAMLNANDLWKM